ncbi:hydroxymethylbilane synthase [Citricoccus sp. SGAir0253]|uniref:hydroxymethylbilane synthase n=1 Tax=Citricoccus sp. SGAir0253 TaxID=2567881 RepID=UPI0010CCD25A|nr:hydroxymethylbilane synthase [Citricoccus sp. SGAir0253]QCU77715.1 hydroxymethylbilane synthase [Citricoccus sp. SGAir0253]
MTGDHTVFTVGTRGSNLARTQTTTVAEALAGASGLGYELRVIRTEGDVTTGSLASLGGTGVFASALRAAVLDGEVELAVHSLKDLPSAQPEGLEIAAVPARVDVRDALCARDGLTLAELPEGATVGTGSPRRVAQLLAVRPDLRVVDIRGNVQTRLARVPGLEQHDDHAPAAAGAPRGDLDAVVLACAGLDRTGLQWAITERLAPTVMLPAPGQGALAVECRPGTAAGTEGPGEALARALADYDDPVTRLQVTAERALLGRLEAGCAAPIGALARVERGADTGSGREDAGPDAPARLVLDAMVAALDGSRVLRRHASVELDAVRVRHADGSADTRTLDTARTLGIEVAEALLADGADLLPAGR